MMMLQKQLLIFVLRLLPIALAIAGRMFPAVRIHLEDGQWVIQLRLRDNSLSRHVTFRQGTIRAGWGLHAHPDADIVFMDTTTALNALLRGRNYASMMDALKTFKITQGGNDAAIVWFGQLINKLISTRWRFGTSVKDGMTRYTTLTIGGPLFVYVKNGKIIRTTPIDLTDDDAPSWSIAARGRHFQPARRATVSSHGLALKSLVYSDKRILHPMKRVDFDPNGERNPQNRGKSGYERITWDEALDIVAGEIKRMKHEYGPGAIAIAPPAHQQLGNVNHYISAMQRFGNLIGYTRVEFSPVSWEGWYWGAMHHYGNNMRLGMPSFYGTVEDCLKEAETIIFWSSDPEATGGCYAGYEGTERRLWAKRLGIKFVHINPTFTATANLLGGKWFPIRPGTDSAMAIAIMQEWILNGTYDRDYVARKSTGFEEWRAYVLGEEDGIPKTPEWQERETSVPARDVRSLAKLWSARKTYLAAGGFGRGLGGACRTKTGAQWARCMVMMMAMQGWGRPGVNFGNLQVGAPQDLNFYFPGYTDGGISGDLYNSAEAINNYCRMAHIATFNPVNQSIPRQRLPEAIINGKCFGYRWNSLSIEGQFERYEYPSFGYSPVHMLYRYGSSSFGTVAGSYRLINAYRHPSLEFVVNQSIWMENEAQFADVILPACTALERNDISEWANCGGIMQHLQTQVNHRMVIFQHKCIEPLGESKSDYQIFLEILTRLGYGRLYSEGGCSGLDWAKRIFDSSDLPQRISWKDFIKKGYHVVASPADAERQPVAMRWYVEGRSKDLPEISALPGEYSSGFRKGLATQSSGFEFVPSTLHRIERNDPERPAVNRYIPAEGWVTSEKPPNFPLHLVTPHPVYSFNTQADGKRGSINALSDHRKLINGYLYWILHMNPADASNRCLDSNCLVRVYNEHASVICALDVSSMVTQGVVCGGYSSAELDLRQTNAGLVDYGGCLNLLTPDQPMSSTADGIIPNSCLVEVENWTEPMELAS